MNTKILFICSANKQRSKTAEDYFSEKHPDIDFKSAGTNVRLCHELGTTAITNELIAWADHIFVMEQKHYNRIKRLNSSNVHRKSTILNIQDIYEYYQKELIAVLEEKTNGF